MTYFQLGGYLSGRLITSAKSAYVRKFAGFTEEKVKIQLAFDPAPKFENPLESTLMQVA